MIYLRSLVLPSHSFLKNSTDRITSRLRHKNMQTIYALKRDGGHGNGRLVDENMIVLRERIREMKVAEKKEEVPSGWTDWERRCYPNYDSDICEAVGLLQIWLMNTRPSLAIGLVAVIALSVPMSVASLMCHLMEMAKHVS